MMDFSYIFPTKMYIYMYLILLVFTYISIVMAKAKYTLLETIEDNQDRNLTSPGYPANYPNNANYTWIIDTGYLAYVYFVVIFMDIKSSQTNQCYDFLEISEIDPCCHTPLKRCGQFDNIHIRTKGNKIRVSFVSDRSETGKGFFLFWNVSFVTSSRSSVTTTSKNQISTSEKIKTITFTRALGKTVPKCISKMMLEATLHQITTDDVGTSMTTTSVNSETTTWTELTTVSPPLPTTTTHTDNRNFLVYIFVVIGVVMVGLLFVMGSLTKHRCSLRRVAPIMLNEDRMSLNENDFNAICIYSSVVQEAATALNEDSQEGIYMEYPEDVYDTTFVKRPHAKQSNQNIYGICEADIQFKSEERPQE